MKIIEKTKKLLNKIFFWHLRPSSDELNIKSFFEFSFYTLITCILVWVFYLWHSVPERTIVVALGQPEHNKEINNGIMPSISSCITLRMPMTTRETESKAGSYLFSFFENNASKLHSDSLGVDITKENLSDELNHEGLNKYEKELLDITCNADSINHYFSSFKKKFPEIERKKQTYFILSHTRGPNSVPAPAKSLDKLTGDGVYNFTRTYAPRDWAMFVELVAHDFICYEKPCSNIGDVFGITNIFRLDDISQAYYNIRVQTQNVDSLTLKIDFVGVADFSKMIPQPDEIGMGYIKFYNQNKVRQIQKEGLHFHAKFKELDNMQTIRLLAITTVLGGIIIIYVAILFVGLYKFFRWARRNKIWAIIICIIFVVIIIYALDLTYSLENYIKYYLQK